MINKISSCLLLSMNYRPFTPSDSRVCKCGRTYVGKCNACTTKATSQSFANILAKKMQ